MSGLNYQHLKYFWLVAGEGNLSQAAERLKISRSAVSAQIQLLEESLGCDLFERKGRELVLTTTGRRVYTYADQVFRMEDSIWTAVKNSHQRESITRIRIGVSDAIPKLAVQRITAPLLEIENVRLEFYEPLATAIPEMMEHGQIDLAISDSPGLESSKPEFVTQLVLQSPVYLYAPEHLWKLCRRNFTKSLNGAPFFLPTTGTQLRSSLDGWFHANHIEPKVLAEFNDAALMRTFGQNGAVFFPATALVQEELEVYFGMKAYKDLAGIRESFYATYRANKPSSGIIRDALSVRNSTRKKIGSTHETFP